VVLSKPLETRPLKPVRASLHAGSRERKRRSHASPAPTSSTTIAPTFYDDYVSLATTDGRIEADYVLPDRDSDTPHPAYLFSDEYETTGAELHRKHGEWQLHIHCKKEMEPDTPEQAITENGTVLGVDLGVNNLAVTSTGTFWTGDEFDHWRREYEKRRGDLQECGTRWAHENMQAVQRRRPVQNDASPDSERACRGSL
jgi:hypothetical protein